MFVRKSIWFSTFFFANSIYRSNVLFLKIIYVFPSIQWNDKFLLDFISSIESNASLPIRYLLSLSKDIHLQYHRHWIRRVLDVFRRQLLPIWYYWHPHVKQVSNAKTLTGSESKEKEILFFGKMETLSGLVKVTLPNYLSNLPIPDSFTGWFKLGCKYWAHLIIYNTFHGSFFSQ